MGVKIIVDSTCDFSKIVKEQIEHIVPLTIRFGDEEYIDGVTMDYKKFYEKLVESDDIPTTSQATPADFAEYFDKVKANGDSAVVITISSKLSGTYQSASIAAMDYDDIYVVDSTSVTISAGILAQYALKLAENGMSAKEIASTLNEKKKDVVLVAMLDTLEYLKKGGRISAAAAFAGGVLNIKPVISIDNGEIITLGKARGVKQGNVLLQQEIKKAGGIDFEQPLLLGYTGLSDDMLQNFIADSKDMWEIDSSALNFSPVGAVIGTHAGPGAIAVAFFKKN